MNVNTTDEEVAARGVAFRTLMTTDLTWACAYWCAFWFAGWPVCMVIARQLPKSSRADENANLLTSGQTLLATVRSVFVSVGAFFAPHDDFLNHCGLAFFTFEIVDLLVGLWFRLHGKDMLLHHAVHIAAGGLIWAADLHALARPLLMQEASSIFLNIWYLTRNRAGELISNVFFLSFAIMFAIVRVGNGSWAAVKFFRGGTHPILGYLVLIGAAMQQYWGYTIGVKVYTALSGSSPKPSKKE